MRTGSRTVWSFRRGRVVLSCLVAVMAGCVFATPDAQAGTYSINAQGAAFCSLGTFISNVPGFGTACDNSVGETQVVAPAGGAASGDRQLFQISSPSPALTITDANPTGGGVELEGGYGGGTYWNGGGEPDFADSGAISSQYWGFQIVCDNDCYPVQQGTLPPYAQAAGVYLTVSENSGPNLGALGLWSQAGGWVWNPLGDPWPLTVTADDPSGVCTMSYALGSQSIDSPSQSQDSAVWQQCPEWDWTSAVDTTAFEATSGQLPFSVRATNAAGVSTSAGETLNIDNVQPTVSITPLNDANPGGWAVNHSVTLQIAATVGPSGMSSLTCSDTVAGVTQPLTMTADPSVTGDEDVTVDGNGAHAVSCTAANNAVDPQGAHNTGTATATIDIDEQPPNVSFEATNPSNPDQVVVDTSDNESQVASGSIQIAAQGSSSPEVLPTTLTSNGQLVATIPDASLKAGAYTLQASATSQVGNVGTTTESVTLPLRTHTTEAVSFARIKDPLIAKKITERVRVGFHYVTEKKRGKTVKVKLGGHFRTITVIKRVEHCTTQRVKLAKHRWKLRRTCVKPAVHYQHRLTVGFDKTTAVYGELTTNQDLPLVDQTVEIEAIPANGSDKIQTVATATTNAQGGWKAEIPAGPSRKIRAVYPGADTLLPTSNSAELTVPARIAITIKPRRLRWSGYLTIKGHLKGGYVPKDGVALRLLVRYPGSRAASPLLAFRTDKKGDFSIRWTFNAGRGTLKLPFWVATDSNESDYPYAAASSRRIPVTFTG